MNDSAAVSANLDIDSDDVQLFRAMAERLAREEYAPHHAKWEKDGEISREAWRQAGASGFLCCDLAEEFGGPGGDFRHTAAVIEVLAATGMSGPCYSFMVHSDIVTPYFRRYGSPEIQAQWLPRLAKGEAIGAIAMTEPCTGSDLKAIRTQAVAQPNGSYILNGSKTFITNGNIADVIIVAAKTSPEKGAKGVSLFVLDAQLPGLRRGHKLEKLGMKACDTAELFFDDLRLPPGSVLGEVDQGFKYLMGELPRERLVIAIAAQASSESILKQTIAYTRERKVFGKPIAEYQNTAFRLAELHAQLVMGRSFLNDCIRRQCAGTLDTETAAMAKLNLTELQGQVMDACVQFHGGYGYMWEQPVTRAYADARVMRIFGGTNEIMRELISRKLIA